MTDTSLSDTLAVRALLERIAVEKQWSKEDVEGDLAILAKNRLVSVKDLKSLSNESWTQIELLPLVKDLLRAAINPNWPTNGDLAANNNQKNISSEEEEVKKDKKKKNKKKIKEFKSTSTLGTPVVPTVLKKPPVITTNQLAEDASHMSLDSSEDHLTVQNTIRNGGSFGVPVDDDDDYIISPTTGTRRKVSFFSEAVTGGALDNSDNSPSIDDEQKKKEKKEKKKEKKKKKKELKNAENTEGNEITEITEN